MPKGVEHMFSRVRLTQQHLLVVEDRCGAAILLKNLNDFLEVFVARVLDLVQLIARVFAVLANDQNGIHCEFIAATTEGFGDGGVNLEAELFRAAAAQIVFSNLIDISRHNLEGWVMPLSFDGIAVQEPLGHVPGVAAVEPDIGDHCKFLARVGSWVKRSTWVDKNRCPSGSQKSSTRNHVCIL